MIASRPTIVKEWTADFCFENKVLKEIPLWIGLPKLPLICWSEDSLSIIGSVVRKSICADECTSQQRRISYARLLVEVDITKPLQYNVKIEREKGVVIDQKIYYEWVPPYCQSCQKVGHVCKENVEKKGVQGQQKQWVKKIQVSSEITVNTMEKQKEKLIDEWIQPKKVASPTIQVGHLHIPTKNGFQGIQEAAVIEEIQGRDLLPFPPI